MTQLSPYEPDQPILEPEEVAFILALRERLAKLESLWQESQEERREWEATHPDDEPYVALSMPGSKGAAAYSECVEVMAGTALDAFDLAARAVGASGWQASVAQMQFLGRSRRIEGPWGIYTMDDALYPQYDVIDRLEKLRWSDDTVQWLGDCAEYALATDRGVESVRQHWRWLVAQRDERVNSQSASSSQEQP